MQLLIKFCINKFIHVYNLLTKYRYEVILYAHNINQIRKYIYSIQLSTFFLLIATTFY